MTALLHYQEHHPKQAEPLTLLRQQLVQGKPWAKHFVLPILPPLLIHTLCVAERSSKLAPCFDHMGTYCAQQHASRERLRRALYYPLTLCALLLTAILCFLPDLFRIYKLYGANGPYPRTIAASCGAPMGQYDFPCGSDLCH